MSRTQMTAEEYKSARHDLDYILSDWIEKLGISIDTHKNYCSGRIKVGRQAQAHIHTLYAVKQLKNELAETQRRLPRVKTFN